LSVDSLRLTITAFCLESSNVLPEHPIASEDCSEMLSTRVASIPAGAWRRRLATLSISSHSGSSRVNDITRGDSDLTVADLTNRRTHEGDHDQRPVEETVARFERARSALVACLQAAGNDVLERSARHPRLGTPMRLIDLAYFVAEHDDHHLVRIRELVTIRGTDSREL
jgi:hypothetical protein